MWSRAASNFIALISISIISSNAGNFFWSWILRVYRSSGKEKGSRCLVYASPTKREISQFHVVVVRWRQRNVQKSVMHVQSCCFADLNLLLFFRSRWRRRCCLSFVSTNNQDFYPKKRTTFSLLQFRRCSMTHCIIFQLFHCASDESLS